MNVATEAAAPSTSFLAVLLGVLLVWWLLRLAGGSRRADVCERHGHVPDPDTVGRRNERCRRCGARIR